MADGDGASAGVEDRFTEPAPAFGPGDLRTSPEALAVLRDHGVDAWREWAGGHVRAWLPGEFEAHWADVGPVLPVALFGDRAWLDPEAKRLHQYWTAGPGLAEWKASPKPWRTLRKLLSKYMSGAQLDATTSAWYRDVFGVLPGQRR